MNTQAPQASLEDFIDFIKVAHAGQIDKGAGKPYWEHPKAVMDELPPFVSRDVKVAALLHDVVEDTPFVIQGDKLVFSEKKLRKQASKGKTDPAEIEAAMQKKLAAMRAAEIQNATDRGEPNPEETPRVLESPPVSEKSLTMVAAVTKEEVLPPGYKQLPETEQKAIKLKAYHDSIVGLAQHRPEDPVALALADEIALLKFADMSQNTKKSRVVDAADINPAQFDKFAEKYSVPLVALIERAKEVGERHGYNLTAETELVGEPGKRKFYLTDDPKWSKVKSIEPPRQTAL